MSTILATRLLLENGDVMGRDEFMRRYKACEDLEHVELIEGVVYMPSPIKLISHGGPQALVLGWLVYYGSRHQGEVIVFAPGTVLLDESNVPEPDAMLCRITPNMYSANDYLAKAPELIVEIANSSV